MSTPKNEKIITIPISPELGPSKNAIILNPTDLLHLAEISQSLGDNYLKMFTQSPIVIKVNGDYLEGEIQKILLNKELLALKFPLDNITWEIQTTSKIPISESQTFKNFSDFAIYACKKSNLSRSEKEELENIYRNYIQKRITEIEEKININNKKVNAACWAQGAINSTLLSGSMLAIGITLFPPLVFMAPIAWPILTWLFKRAAKKEYDRQKDLILKRIERLRTGKPDPEGEIPPTKENWFMKIISFINKHILPSSAGLAALSIFTSMIGFAVNPLPFLPTVASIVGAGVIAPTGGFLEDYILRNVLGSAQLAEELNELKQKLHKIHEAVHGKTSKEIPQSEQTQLKNTYTSTLTKATSPSLTKVTKPEKAFCFIVACAVGLITSLGIIALAMTFPPAAPFLFAATPIGGYGVGALVYKQMINDRENNIKAFNAKINRVEKGIPEQTEKNKSLASQKTPEIKMSMGEKVQAFFNKTKSIFKSPTFLSIFFGAISLITVILIFNPIIAIAAGAALATTVYAAYKYNEYKTKKRTEIGKQLRTQKNQLNAVKVKEEADVKTQPKTVPKKTESGAVTPHNISIQTAEIPTQTTAAAAPKQASLQHLPKIETTIYQLKDFDYCKIIADIPNNKLDELCENTKKAINAFNYEQKLNETVTFLLLPNAKAFKVTCSTETFELLINFINENFKNQYQTSQVHPIDYKQRPIPQDIKDELAELNNPPLARSLPTVTPTATPSS